MNVWVENKRAKTTFYTLKNSEKPVQNAVEELKKSIRLLTGAEVPSKEITQIDEVKNGVVFATFSALPKGLFAEEKEFLLGTDGFAVRAMGNVLYVLSHTAGGVFFGAHDLLERNAEIIWTRAKRGEEVSYIPSENLVLKEYDYVDKPDFISRGWNTCGDGEEGHHHDLGTMICFAKNKINTKFEIYLDMFADYGVDVQGLYDPSLQDYSEYYTLHPEYFMTDENGLPKKNQGELSFLNYYRQDVAELVAERILALYKKKPSAIGKRIYIGMPDDDFFRMTDGDGNVISRQPFTADDGTVVLPTEEEYRATVFYNFLNRVVKKVCAVYPQARFMTLAYLYAFVCPKIDVDERLAIGVCPIGLDEHTPYEYIRTEAGKASLEKMRKWCKKVPDVFLYSYWQSLRGVYPRPLAKTVQKNLRYVKEMGIRHVIPEGYLDGANRWGNDDKFDMNELYYWQMNKLFWKVESDLDRLTEKYCRLVYGEARQEMISFYQFIQEGWDKKDIFVTWATGNDLYIRQCILQAGLKDKILGALKSALKKDLQPAQKRRISSIYSQLKEQIQIFESLSDEKAEATFCEFGKDFILSQEQLAVEENAQSVWNKAKKLSNFRNFMTSKPYNPDAKLNIRLLWDEEYLYVGIQTFDDQLARQEGFNEAGKPVYLRENGEIVNSYGETYVGGNKDTDTQFYGYIAGLRSTNVYKNDGAPSYIPTPKGFKEAFYLHVDDKAENRYYFYVQAIAWKDLGVSANTAKPYGSFVYESNRYGLCGWKGNGLWCKENFEEIYLINKGEKR